MRLAIRVAAALMCGAVAVAGLVACGESAPASPSPDTPPSATTGTPSVAPTSDPDPSPPASAPASPVIVVDASLLDILPPEVDGIVMRPDPETAAEIATAPGLGRDVVGLAVALYVASEATGGEDLAIVNVVEPRAGAATDGWFRSWRETYDAAACEPAGGTSVGSATAEIAGRDVHIGTCENGGHTYHVRLEDPDRIVSLTSIGELRLGERIVGDLKE